MRKMTSLFTELAIRVALIISITDAIIFYLVWKRGIECLTVRFVIAVIIVTIIPILVSLWWCLIFRG